MFLLQGVYISADWLTINDFGPSRVRSTSFAIFMQFTKKTSFPRAASLRIRVRSSMLTRFLREDSRRRATYTISNRKSDGLWGIKEELRTGVIEQGNLAVRRLGAALTTPVRQGINSIRTFKASQKQQTFHHLLICVKVLDDFNFVAFLGYHFHKRGSTTKVTNYPSHFWTASQNIMSMVGYNHRLHARKCSAFESRFQATGHLGMYGKNRQCV